MLGMLASEFTYHILHATALGDSYVLHTRRTTGLIVTVLRGSGSVTLEGSTPCIMLHTAPVEHL